LRFMVFWRNLAFGPPGVLRREVSVGRVPLLAAWGPGPWALTQERASARPICPGRRGARGWGLGSGGAGLPRFLGQKSGACGAWAIWVVEARGGPLDSQHASMGRPIDARGPISHWRLENDVAVLARAKKIVGPDSKKAGSSWPGAKKPPCGIIGLALDCMRTANPRDEGSRCSSGGGGGLRNGLAINGLLHFRYDPGPAGRGGAGTTNAAEKPEERPASQPRLRWAAVGRFAANHRLCKGRG